MYPVHSVKPMSSMTAEAMKELFGLSTLPESDKALDPSHLPYETIEEFSYDGLEFEEAARQIWDHLVIMHYHAGTYNRQSDWFPVACSQLEKLIKIAGSFCITKTVLEAGGEEFPTLKNMNIQTLYGLTSYYFRKCGKAFDEIYDKAGLISVPMHNWEMRWLALGERLKATEAKCQKIREGKIKIETMLEQQKQCSGKTGAGPSKPLPEPKELQLCPRALPLLDSYARQIKRERNHAAREKYYNDRIQRLKEESERQKAIDAAREAREAARKHREERRKNKSGSVPSQKKENTSAAVPTPKQKAEPEEMNLPELRKTLIEKAKERGEESEILQIIGEPPEKLRERLRRYQQEAAPRRDRPPDGTVSQKKKKKKR